MTITHVLGIDVQTARGCACAIMRRDGQPLACFWNAHPDALVQTAFDHIQRDGGDAKSTAVGIDAPRVLLHRPRPYYWNGARQRWRERRADEEGHGRHCEIVVAAHNLAKPQWTPFQGHEPLWMTLGVQLFAHFAAAAATYEVFPSASYTLFVDDPATLTLPLAALAPGPKDMLDAFIAAITVREYVAGRGVAVGGGDHLGTIILPRPLPTPIPAVLTWPAPPQANAPPPPPSSPLGNA